MNQNDQLSSWKEIAFYLHCDVRTCIRWENKYDLPIHRIEGSKGARVFAYKTELDEWLRIRNENKAEPIRKKSRFQIQKKIWLKFLLIAFPLSAAVIFILIISRDVEKPSPLVLSDMNIITAELAGAGRMRIWGHIGNSAYENIWTTESAEHPIVAMGDVDNDGENEIIAPGFIDDKDNVTSETLIYYIYLNVYKENGEHLANNIWKTTKDSEEDQFIGFEKSGISNILFVDVNEDGAKEIVLISKGGLHIFKYNKKEEKLKFWTSRGRFLDLYLNLVSVAILPSKDNFPLRIYIIANEIDKEGVLIKNKGWLMICEMKEDWPLHVDSIPVNVTFEKGSLKSGYILEEETQQLFAIGRRKIGEFFYPVLMGWNKDGEQIIETPINGLKSPQSRSIHLEVGDVDREGLEEIVVGTNEPDMLILYKRENESLIEAARHSIPQDNIVINNMFIADMDNNHINEIVVGGACLNVENRLEGFYLEIFGITPEFQSKWSQLRREIGENPVQYAVFGKKKISK
ncbi:hypothetical protein ACFLRX_08725 [Acidobacteriota bacterium]